MVNKSDVIHKITIEERKHLVITGVNRVKSFEPKEIVLETNRGGVTIKGRDLSVHNLNLEQSELEIEGQIDVVTYAVSSTGESSKGVWQRIFK
ncbi:sporulation protein YabP [Dehalobacter sp. DCM]|uniref:sporulation protein YabP n=1 Tax=Dehalobacter sp. DCM TaxID=2907827 RepID=UPI0030820E73|nr:sporulation protein YabP [Dehalobacter sp. DCM]